MISCFMRTTVVIKIIFCKLSLSKPVIICPLLPYFCHNVSSKFWIYPIMISTGECTETTTPPPGTTPSPCGCSNKCKPVCGTDGVTYRYVVWIDTRSICVCACAMLDAFIFQHTVAQHNITNIVGMNVSWDALARQIRTWMSGTKANVDNKRLLQP